MLMNRGGSIPLMLDLAARDLTVDNVAEHGDAGSIQLAPGCL